MTRMDDVTERTGGASGQARGRVSNRAIASAALAVAVFVAGCNSRTGNPAGPSAAGGAPEAHSGSDRFLKAAISPTSVTAGSSETYTVRVTNCDARACSSGTTVGRDEHQVATMRFRGLTVDGAISPQLSSPPWTPGSWHTSALKGTEQLCPRAWLSPFPQWAGPRS